MKTRSHRRRTMGDNNAAGFTLVELLIVISLVAALAGIASATYQGVAETAREARTRAIIAAVDRVIQEKYESYKYRPFAVEIPNLFSPPAAQTTADGAGIEIGYEVLATEAARMRLMMTRDLQRIEMPDRYTDISLTQGNAISLNGAVNPVVERAGVIVNSRDRKEDRRMMSVNWVGSSALQSYRGRFSGTEDATNQGAECLYLIMSTTVSGGISALEAIPETNIGDTDNDGMKEILDGWGRPLGFVRWPVGFVDPNGGVDRAVPDDFDMFRIDYGLVSGTTDVAKPYNVETSTRTNQLPWSIRPLVISAGSDGEFGITTNPWGDNGSGNVVELPAYSFTADWNWTLDTDHYGIELTGRTRGGASSFKFADPYMRNHVAANVDGSGNFTGLLPGQALSGSLAASERVDNLTNYSIQAQ